MITKEFAVHLNAALETPRLMLEPLMAAHPTMPQMSVSFFFQNTGDRVMRAKLS